MIIRWDAGNNTVLRKYNDAEDSVLRECGRLLHSQIEASLLCKTLNVEF